MKPETHQYLRARRSPGHVPGEFIDSLPDVDGTLEEVIEQASQEGWQRLQEKFGPADTATELTRHDQDHSMHEEDQ